MTPLDIILWALAILIATAAFVLVMLLLNNLVRALLRRTPRPTKDAPTTYVFGGDHGESLPNAADKRGRGDRS